MPDPPLRRDAERNRQLLLSHAADLMAREGLDVSYEQIARAAGTGMGTVYRRFPEREALVDAVFAQHIEAVVLLAEKCATDPDPWAGITRFMTRQLELEWDNRALGELLRGGAQSSELVRRGREQITPRVTVLIDRAVAAAVLPAGSSAADLVLAHLMVGGVMDAVRSLGPEGEALWRHALAAALAGLRTTEHPKAWPPGAALDRLVDSVYTVTNTLEDA